MSVFILPPQPPPFFCNFSFWFMCILLFSYCYFISSSFFLLFSSYYYYLSLSLLSLLLLSPYYSLQPCFFLDRAARHTICGSNLNITSLGWCPLLNSWILLGTNVNTPPSFALDRVCVCVCVCSCSCVLILFYFLQVCTSWLVAELPPLPLHHHHHPGNFHSGEWVLSIFPTLTFPIRRRDGSEEEEEKQCCIPSLFVLPYP